jgi:hypothetical protein
MNPNSPLHRSLQMRTSLLSAANQSAMAAAAAGNPSALLASQAAAMFNHQSSLFAANLKSSAAANAAAAAAAGMNPVPTSGSGEIDFSLPITSTYLRRMRALGLAAAAGIEQGNYPGSGGGGRVQMNCEVSDFLLARIFDVRDTFIAFLTDWRRVMPLFWGPTIGRNRRGLALSISDHMCQRVEGVPYFSAKG